MIFQISKLSRKKQYLLTSLEFTLLTPEELLILANYVKSSSSSSTIRQGVGKISGKRIQIEFSMENFSSLPPVIREKLRELYLAILARVPDTHSLSPMAILLSLEYCEAQDCHTDYSLLTEVPEGVSVPYFLLVPLGKE